MVRELMDQILEGWKKWGKEGQRSWIVLYLEECFGGEEFSGRFWEMSNRKVVQK
jgi:hypothetical protein